MRTAGVAPHRRRWSKFARVGWQHLWLDAAQRRVRQPGGVMLDLSAIAKGYGVDVVADLLRRRGIDAGLIEVGGELYAAMAARPTVNHGACWWNPHRMRKPTAKAWNRVLALEGMAVATSGDRWHAYAQDGHRYSHTIDPRSGEPVTDAAAAVTVIVSMRCAPMSATALTVMGTEEGPAFAAHHGLAARFLATPHRRRLAGNHDASNDSTWRHEHGRPFTRHGSAALVGNALVMQAMLAACAWLFAGLHEGDWWQTSPSRARVCIAAAALLAYAGLVAGILSRARKHDTSGQPVMLAGSDAMWVVHASQTGFAMELADMTAASLRHGGVAVQRARGWNWLDAGAAADYRARRVRRQHHRRRRSA